MAHERAVRSPGLVTVRAEQLDELCAAARSVRILSVNDAKADDVMRATARLALLADQVQRGAVRR